MSRDPKPAPMSEQAPGSVLILAALSVVVGAAAGLLTALFRLALERADHVRNLIVGWAHGWGALGLALVVAAAAAATGVSAWLVRRFAPSARGSGIPHVEAVLRGKLSSSPPHLILVKFVGGVLAIGAGLALGREGPSVQMGASLAHSVGVFFRRTRVDVLALMAAGAGAGLATAFNAPVAGAVFILEEVVRRFDLRHTISTLGASACAIAVSRVFLGGAPDFAVAPLPYPGSETLPLFLALGLVAGLLGVAYNYAIIGALRSRNASTAGRWKREPR